MAAKTKEKTAGEKIEQTSHVESKTKELKGKEKIKEKKKGTGRFILLIIILFILSGLVAVVGFNAFGLRAKYLNGFLQNIPIVKNFIPVENNVEGEYLGWTPEQLIAEINTLNTIIEKDAETIKSLNDKSDLYIKEISRLKEFEDQQVAFKAEKEEFDKMIASNDMSAYAKFYESINPDNAEALYKEAILANQDTKLLRDYVAAFKAMDETDAARILEQMITTDMNLVVMIVNNLDSETRGTIFGQMTPANAASVAKMTAPAVVQQ